MKKNNMLLLFALLLGCNSSYAQIGKYSDEFGKITTEEMTMKEYVFDKDAEAVVLYEKGVNRFLGDHTSGRFIMYLERQVKIKILKQAGIKYGEFEIPYHEDGNNMEEIIGLEAFTYNFDNDGFNKSELELKNIFEEKQGKNLRIKKFAMPNVREGSVVEVKYTITTPFYFNMREWQFQKKIPVISSKLEYRAIPYFEYSYLLKGANKFHEMSNKIDYSEQQFGNLKYKEVVYVFGMKNLPAFKDEEFITSARDYMIALNFQLVKRYDSHGSSVNIMSTWPQICTELLKDNDFGKYINAAEKEGKKLIHSLNISGKSQVEQIKIITQYVKQNYNWNEYMGKYASSKVSEFLKKKTGNSSDINLFLIGILRAAGIEANPIALSTRTNGLVRAQYPFAQSLNYVIVQAVIPDTAYLLDATEPMLCFNELPRRCVNVIGLVVKPKSDKWIDVIQNDLALTEKVFDIKFNESLNTLNINTTVTSHSYDAYDYRSIYRGKEENLIKWMQQREAEPIGNIEEVNYKDIEKPFIFKYKSEQTVESNDNKLFVAPFLNQSVTEIFFKQTQRKLPIDLIYLHSCNYTSVIDIPKGYVVEYLPEKLEDNNKVLKINYNAIQEKGKIYVVANYVFTSNVYASEDYPLLKSSYEKIVKKFNEVIVLVKE